MASPRYHELHDEAAFILMIHAATIARRWLSTFYEIGKEAVRPRKNGELFGFCLRTRIHEKFLNRAASGTHRNERGQI
jgi:hypothetical protein